MRTATKEALPRIALSLGVAIAGIVTACHNDVPGMDPLAPEVQPQGPRPGPLTPVPARVDTDAGLPLPGHPEPAASASSFGHEPLRVADAPRDASVNDVIDLPPIVDADLPIMLDGGGKPL